MAKLYDVSLTDAERLLLQRTIKKGTIDRGGRTDTASSTVRLKHG